MNTTAFYIVLRENTCGPGLERVDNGHNVKRVTDRRDAEETAKAWAKRNPGVRCYVFEAYSFAFKAPPDAEMYRCTSGSELAE
jgi:hypothetical protein